MNYSDFLDAIAPIDDAAIELARAEDRADPYAGEEPPDGYVTRADERAAWDSAHWHADGLCDCPAGAWNTGEAPW